MALPPISTRSPERSISSDGAAAGGHRIVEQDLPSIGTAARTALLCLAVLLTPGATVPKAHPTLHPLSGAPPALPAMRPEGSSGDGAGEVQAQMARAFNASIPVARGSLVPAQPFYLDASFADRARALDCLAAADFYEAGGDPSDQRAVAQVVLNRVRHVAFPATICGVVFDGADRPTGCQFTFTCDGSLYRRRPTPSAWQQARRVAAEMLLGRVDTEVGQATHYHTDWVSPIWDRTMDKLAIVKTHLFFRWRGAGGAPSAFTKRYGGSEPRILRLAALSAAHAGAEAGTEGAELAAVAAAAPQVAPAPPALSLHDQGVFLVTLPVAAGPDSFRRMAEQQCAGLSDCRFVGWTNPARRADTLPLPGSAVDAISFTFVRHPDQKTGRAQWNCAEFPRVNTEECLHRAD
ncbi:cell wall hydrolase [Novosphingobium sp. BL-8A]|uniref:cell wall hydrolase n=1 Tax=Novosphingobium sp. BL-8A TaxID=3127639 RepID=UPI0037582108